MGSTGAEASARQLRLNELFQRNGYVRVPNMDRRAEERQRYKKGWEVRLVARDESAAARLAVLAASLGYRPGRLFAKGQQYVVPVYGRAAVNAFLEARGAHPISGGPTRLQD